MILFLGAGYGIYRRRENWAWPWSLPIPDLTALVGAAWPYDAGFVCEDDYLDPVAQSELGQDAGDVACSCLPCSP